MVSVRASLCVFAPSVFIIACVRSAVKREFEIFLKGGFDMGITERVRALCDGRGLRVEVSR